MFRRVFHPKWFKKITINIYKHNIYSSCFNLWRSFKSLELPGGGSGCRCGIHQHQSGWRLVLLPCFQNSSERRQPRSSFGGLSFDVVWNVDLTVFKMVQQVNLQYILASLDLFGPYPDLTENQALVNLNNSHKVCNSLKIFRWFSINNRRQMQ